MNLSKYIAELLVKNNCVIVPNFGGFIANYSPAVIDNFKQKIYPPSKSVLFNPNLLNNDGLLANYVASKINIDYSESLTKISDISKNWKTQLKDGERISIGEVGFLYQSEGNIQFEQDREFNLYLGAFGLSSVNFVPFNETVKDKTKQPSVTIPIQKDSEPLFIQFGKAESIEPEKNNKKSDVILELPKRKSNRWKYIAAACFLPALFYSYWIPMETHYLDSGNIQLADLSPFNKKAKKIFNTRIEKTIIEIPKNELSLFDKIKASSSTVEYYNYQFSEDLYIPIKFELEKIDKTNVAKSESNSVTVKSVSQKNNNHLIAGCFGNKQNAKKLVSDFISKGYKASIIDKNKNLFRVAIQSFPSKKEAIKFKSDLQSKSISTWLLIK